MIKNLDKDKENLILSTLKTPKTTKEIIQLSKMADKTARVYIKLMEKNGKLIALPTYPITYTRVARKDWPLEEQEKANVSLTKGLSSRPDVVSTLMTLMVNDEEVSNPILKAIKESIAEIREDKLTLQALKLFVAECSTALNKMDRI